MPVRATMGNLLDAMNEAVAAASLGIDPNSGTLLPPRVPVAAPLSSSASMYGRSAALSVLRPASGISFKAPISSGVEAGGSSSPTLDRAGSYERVAKDEKEETDDGISPVMIAGGVVALGLVGLVVYKLTR